MRPSSKVIGIFLSILGEKERAREKESKRERERERKRAGERESG